MTPNSDWKDILQAAHRDPLDPAHYTAVRSRVLAEIERARSPWRRYAWLSGAIAATLALLLLKWDRLQPVNLPAPRALTIPSPALQPVPQLAIAPKPRSRPMRERPREPLTIKLQTEDPNIVIYWIAD